MFLDVVVVVVVIVDINNKNKRRKDQKAISLLTGQNYIKIVGD